MRTKRNYSNGSAEKTVKAIRRATRRQYAAEEKIRMVLKGLRGEESITELCRWKVQTTARYAQLARDSVKLAAEPVADRLAADLDTTENVSVVK